MPTEALLAVLIGAILHAGWNTTVKSGSDKRLNTTLVAGGAAAIAVLLLPWLDAPATASLPFLASSAGLQLLYFRLVAAAYQAGDMMSVILITFTRKSHRTKYLFRSQYC
jgi:hypothetical protein